MPDFHNIKAGLTILGQIFIRNILIWHPAISYLAKRNKVYQCGEKKPPVELY